MHPVLEGISYIGNHVLWAEEPEGQVQPNRDNLSGSWYFIEEMGESSEHPVVSWLEWLTF